MYENNDTFNFNHISGDVLAIEKPYAGELSNASYQYNCHYCFKRCLTNLPCLICNWVRIFYSRLVYYSALIKKMLWK